MTDLTRLKKAAHNARDNAYAPYSKYSVGAAVLGINGKVYAGCNVENVSFPVGVCAERVAVSSMVADGCQRLTAVIVMTRDGGTPCGMCRQFIAEFAESPADVTVVCLSDKNEESTWTLDQLLPHGFVTDVSRG